MWTLLDGSGPFSQDDIVDMYVEGSVTKDTPLVGVSPPDDGTTLTLENREDLWDYVLLTCPAPEEMPLPAEGAPPPVAAVVAPPAWFDLKVNTSIYITGIPADATVVEVNEFFSRAGLIKKTKIYGGQKGDGLVTFARPEAVHTAIENLSGMYLRPGCKLQCEPAKFEMRGETYVPKKGVDDAASKVKEKKRLREKLSWDDSKKGGGEDAPPPRALPGSIVMFMGALPPAEKALPSGKDRDAIVNALAALCSAHGVTVEADRIYRKTRIVTLQFQSAEEALKVVANVGGTTVKLGVDGMAPVVIQCEVYTGSQNLKE